MDFTIRKITAEDSQAIVEIDAIHTGKPKPKYWQERLKPFIEPLETEQLTLGYVAISADRVIGYILAEGRAWEFGSPLCGWIFAIGVDPNCGRKGVGLALCREVCTELKSMNIMTVRTMVRKDDIEVLSFFRASGFHAGPFIELELDL